MNVSISIMTHLESIFRDVQRAVAAGDVGSIRKPTRNAKGDIVKWFDLTANEAVCAYLKERFPYSTVLLSEEGLPRKFGNGQPEFTVVLDPVDGSDNFARGIAPVSMAVALIPRSCPISVESVQYALVGDLVTGHICIAERGNGASCDGKQIRAGTCNILKSAMISCEMNHFAVRAPLANVLSRARGVRSLGCATQAITLVAYGSIDAHLDLRDRLTPENFLAPSLILTEAGGTISGPEGEPIPDITDLTQRFSIIASGSPELHAVLVQQLKGDTVCT
ncbi:MAG: inositol monophosphatase family protein [candidate division Zixibacteria bacterium]